MKTSIIVKRLLACCAAAALMLAALPACPDEATAPEPAPPPDEAHVDLEPLPEPDPEPAMEPFDAIVVAAAAGLRRAPTMDRHIQQEEDGGRIANWLLTLYRGDVVTVTRSEEHGGESWVWADPPGDHEGWLKEEWLMPAEEGSPATTLGELRVFDMPDPTRPRAGQTIEPGTYLVVVATEGDFSRVNHVAQRTAWVRTRDLSTGEGEIGASRVISRVRWMKGRGDTDGIETLVEGAEEAFPGARLLSVLHEVAREE